MHRTPSAPAHGAACLLGWHAEPDALGTIGFTQGNDAPVTAAAREPVLLDKPGHIMTIAPTGAGKGTGAVIPTLLSYPGSIVVIDPKGENYAVTARRRRAMGQNVILLDPFRCIAPDGSDCFNPLDCVSKETEGAQDSYGLAELISMPTTPHDPFWDETSRTVLAGLIALVARARPPVLRNLGEVRYLINQPLDDLAFTRKELMKTSDPTCQSAAAILETEARCLLSILATARVQVRFLTEKFVEQATSRTTIDIGKFTRNEPVSIYIVLPPERLASHARLLRLWIGIVMNTLIARRSNAGLPTLFLLDEAAQLGAFEQLRTAMTLLRGYGTVVWSFWQDLSQLQRLYPADWLSLVNNCSAIQYFGAANYMAATSIAAVTGFGPPERILNLADHQMILSRARRMPDIVTRPDYLSDAIFRGQYDPNPLYSSIAR